MVEITPFLDAHFELLRDWIASPELMVRWSGNRFSHPLDQEQFMAHVRQGGTHAFLATRDRQPVGYGELGGVEPHLPVARLCRVLIGDRGKRGLGLGSSLVASLLRLGFEDLRLHRIELTVLMDNPAARACYANAGFEGEGPVRDACRVGERYETGLRMSLLAPEWRARERDAATPREATPASGQEFDLDGVLMNVIRTAATGVVSSATVFRFRQDGDRVWAQYAGGAVRQGYLVGQIDGPSLTFRYCQMQATGAPDGGTSTCEVRRTPHGLLQIVERFQWETKATGGTNVLQELPSTTGRSRS